MQDAFRVETEKYESYNMKEEGLNIDILCLWKENKNTFPILSTLARKYLSIKPSNVSSERLGSVSSAFLSRKRCKVTNENDKK